jgi:dsRNA-specific ribonuclease
VCLRLIQRRNISGRGEREIDQKAEENFVENAVSKSVTDLLSNPQRDTHTYDKKPPVRFSTPVISALHARIGLPPSFPLSTLKRCLTDPSVETDHKLHNEALSEIGSGLLEYYVSEYLCVRWPRLPMKTQLAALWAYTGESALTRIAREWGIESQKHENPGEKRDPYSIEASPRLVVDPPKKPDDGLGNDLDQRLEWEIREQARQGWLEPRGGARTNPFLKSLDEKEYEKRFVLFALQRCVQSLVGGVYVHSVLPWLDETNNRTSTSHNPS